MPDALRNKLGFLIAVAALALCSTGQADDHGRAKPSSGGPVPVTIVEEQGRYTLMRGGSRTG
jgi:hypothetical protein